MPEITVLTAVRNGERYLPETIDSIRDQTFQDWEYIIVDDDSTDSTIEIIKTYQDRDKRIKLIQLDNNVGPYVAANIGLKQSNGKYVARIDADDIALPNRLQRQLDFLKQNPRLRACASYAQRIDENSEIIPNRIVKSTLTPGSIKWYLFLRCPLVHSTACVERSVFEKIGGYDSPIAAQDYRLWCYLAQRSIVAQIPEVLVYFRLNPKGISLTQQTLQRKIADKVAQDHILNVTGERWSVSTIEALNAMGELKIGFPVSKAIKASKLWDRYWIADNTLDHEELSELFLLSTYLRKTFLRRNRRKQLFSVAMNGYDYLFPSPKLKIMFREPEILPY